MPISEKRLTASADIRRVFRGSTPTITVELYDEISKQALNVTSGDFVGATASFRADPDTLLVKTGLMVVGPGRLAIALTDPDTRLLRCGEAQSYDLRVNIGGVISIARVDEQLDVVESLF